jgi:hypothetical protein
MPLPIPANTTCDIYRNGHSPPAAPDVAGVAIALQHAAHNTKVNYKTTPSVSLSEAYDYLAYVPKGTDIRDNANGTGNGDTIYVPNQNGTPFLVVWVERLTTMAGDVLCAYFLRQAVPVYPTDNL